MSRSPFTYSLPPDPESAVVCEDHIDYTLVNIKDWCKNDYEVVRQLRINTDYSHHRYDVLIASDQKVPFLLGLNPKN